MKINNRKDINNLLSDLLTPTEILEIYDRIMVVKLLNERVSQKEIACRLKISITTVSR
jgi:Trp operon repressor